MLVTIRSMHETHPEPSNSHKANWLDGHLDLAYIALERTGDAQGMRCAVPDQAGCVSFESLRAAGVRACFGTIFTECGAPDESYGYRDHDDRAGAHAAGLRQLALYESWERAGEIQLVRKPEQLDHAFDNNNAPLAVVLLMECADPISSPADVAFWHARGLRIVGMSWGHGSRYAGGNAREGGLTGEGRELVAALDDAGIAHDVSHLSDESVEDLLECARGPIAATHSNARQLFTRSSPRHLHPDHAREIARRGGVVGINLYTRFLATDRRATIGDVIAHIEAHVEIFGPNHVGLGSDADGGFGPRDLPEHLDHPTKFHNLSAALPHTIDAKSFQSNAWRTWLNPPKK